MYAVRSLGLLTNEVRTSAQKLVQAHPKCGWHASPAACRYHAVRTPRLVLAAARRCRASQAGWLSVARCQSTQNAGSADYIPAPPKPATPDQLAPSVPDLSVPHVPAGDLLEPVQQLNALGEPTLASVGLGGWTPSGIVQQLFEILHANVGLPWWGAIAVGTVAIRLCVFPLVVRSQRNAVKMNNNLPQLQALQVKMTEARQMGNQIEAARWSNELMLFMKEKDINPLKSMLVPMAQIPIFVSVFFGLRKMANLPLMSMKDGGILWFVDLTVPDPYYILPAITSLTLLATIEIGADGAKMNTSPNAYLVRYFLRAMPFVVFPFTINFPAAILCYWVCSNFVALGQVIFLKVPKVRAYFNIPKQVVHDQSKLPIKKRKFVEGVKESWTNMKISKELEDRQRYDEMRFRKAGMGPLVKTYKHDPTKQAVIPPPPAEVKARPK